MYNFILPAIVYYWTHNRYVVYDIHTTLLWSIAAIAQVQFISYGRSMFWKVCSMSVSKYRCNHIEILPFQMSTEINSYFFVRKVCVIIIIN